MIRPYSVQGAPACMDILEGNTPDFFLPTDQQELAAFLDDLPGPYLVVEEHGRIVACGGWAMDPEEVADLTWCMVRREFQRRGIGPGLLQHRLEAIRAGPACRSSECEPRSWCGDSTHGRASVWWRQFRMALARDWTG